MSRILIIAIGIFLMLTDISKAEFIQRECDVENDYVAFALEDLSDVAQSKPYPHHSYIVDFQQNGPTIRLPPEYYAPEWQRVELIAFEPTDKSKLQGRLSLRIRKHSGEAYVQPIGIVQKACWEAAKVFLSRENIKVPISEGINK